MKKHPNIIIFNPDSYRGDVLGHLGNAGAVTPNLDATLGRRAVSYANAFAQNPVCTPSRCSFMTGWYPHTCGHRSMKNMLKDYEPNLFSVLRREGYHVWWGGKNDLFSVESKGDFLKYCDTKHAIETPFREFRMPDPPVSKDDRRYGVYYRGLLTRDGDGPIGNNSDRGHVQGAVDFIKKWDRDQPYCVFLPLGCPHPAYLVEDEFYDMIDPDKLPSRLPVPENDLPMLNNLREGYRTKGVTDEDWTDIRRIYYAMCAKIDFLFGQVVDALVENGVYDDTLIVFLSDHGDFAGDYDLPEKTHGSLQDALIRSPFLIKPHAGVDVQPGKRTHLTELVDMTATIYDLLEIDPEYTCYGRSLRGSLAGDDSEIRSAVFAEVGSRAGEAHFKNLDVKKMDPDSFYGVQSRYALPAHDAGSYAISCRTRDHKYVRRGYVDHYELYDLTKDPGELHNLSGDPNHAELERRMERLLLDHFMTTGDVMPHKQDSRKV